MFREWQFTMIRKTLIGIATLGSPVLKREDQDITFKLRLDL